MLVSLKFPIKQALTRDSRSVGTLLQTIANIKNKGVEAKGDVLFNSRRLRPSDRTQVLSYVAQEAPLLGEFTVHESLWFAARLYFGYFEVDRKTIQAKIDDVIDAVSLDECRDVVVGNLFFRGLSGGQRKRLSIALELISSPACLILDEPTSGLDSAAAFNLLQSLRELAKLGHTLIASLHQPSSKMWAEFSNVMLMSQGHCVYFGSADGAVDYFASIGYKCPDHFNPSDYFSGLLSTDFSMFDNLDVKSAEELAEVYNKSATKRMELAVHLENVDKGRKTLAVGNKKTSRLSGRLSKGMMSVTADNRKYDNLNDDEPRKLFQSNASMKRAGFFSTLFTLLHRFLMSLYRDPGVLLARVGVYIGLGLTLGLFYLNIGRSYDTNALLARASVCLAQVGFYSFLNIAAVPFIMENRHVMDRERKNGAYSVGAYVVADILTIVPASAVLALVASVLVVFMVSLNNFGRFFLGMWVLLFTAECLVQAVSCLFAKMEAAVATCAGAFGVLTLCSGFLTPIAEMNWAIRWISYVSPLRYAFRLFLTNEVIDMNTTDSLQFPSGDALLDFFGINDSDYWTDLGIILALACGYAICIDLGLRFLR